MSDGSITRISVQELLAKRARGEKSLTDWDRVNALTDEDIERAMRDDPDWAGLIDFDWSDAQMVFPNHIKRD